MVLTIPYRKTTVYRVQTVFGKNARIRNDQYTKTVERKNYQWKKRTIIYNIIFKCTIIQIIRSIKLFEYSLDVNISNDAYIPYRKTTVYRVQTMFGKNARIQNDHWSGIKTVERKNCPCKKSDRRNEYFDRKKIDQTNNNSEHLSSLRVQ